MYSAGSYITITRQGNEFGTVYNSDGNETVTLQGSEWDGYPLYAKTPAGAYVAVSVALYRAGSSRTFYKRGSSISGLRYEGSDYTYQALGSVVVTSSTAIYKAGSGGSGELCQIETETVSALAAG